MIGRGWGLWTFIFGTACVFSEKQWCWRQGRSDETFRCLGSCRQVLVIKILLHPCFMFTLETCSNILLNVIEAVIGMLGGGFKKYLCVTPCKLEMVLFDLRIFLFKQVGSTTTQYGIGMSSISTWAPRYCSGMALNVSHAGAVYSSPDYGALVDLLCHFMRVKMTCQRVTENIRCIVPYNEISNKLGWMEHQQNDIQTSLVTEPNFMCRCRPQARKAGALCFLLVLHLRFWGLVGLPLLLPGAFFGGLGCGWTFPRWPSDLMSFFWFWMAGCYQPPPLFIIKKWNMYIYILQFRWVLSTCYKHVEFSPHSNI